MSKAKQFLENLPTISESNTIEFTGKNTKDVVSFLVDHGFKYVTYPNGKLEVHLGNDQYRTIFKDDVVAVKGGKLSITKPSYVSEANSKLPKASFATKGEDSYAFRVEGVEPEFYNRPFGRQLDSLRKAGEFCKDAKSYHVDCKGKSTMACVKAWIKAEKPEQFYAKWTADTSYNKHDSVEVFYKR